LDSAVALFATNQICSFLNGNRSRLVGAHGIYDDELIRAFSSMQAQIGQKVAQVVGLVQRWQNDRKEHTSKTIYEKAQERVSPRKGNAIVFDENHDLLRVALKVLLKTAKASTPGRQDQHFDLTRQTGSLPLPVKKSAAL
jgi:hypothetical protein